jgi:thioredoxin-related protein
MVRKTKSWMPLFLLLLGTGVLGAMRGSRAGGDILWARSYQAGLRTAQQAHLPLLLNFRSSDCGWCSKMDAETFTDPQVVGLSRRFACVRLDSDMDGAVIARYHVLDYPMTLIAAPDGKELLRIPGYVPPERFAPILRAALDAFNKRR